MIKYATLAALAILSVSQAHAQGQALLPNQSILNSTPDTLYVMSIYKAADQAVKLARYDTTFTSLKVAFGLQKDTYKRLQGKHKALEINLEETNDLAEEKEVAQQQLIDLHKKRAKHYKQATYILTACSIILGIIIIIP